MSHQRPGIVPPVSYASYNKDGQGTSNSSAWNSLSSGNVHHHNSTELYTATNFNGTKGYSNQGMRVMRPGVGGFHGNVNILLGGAMLTVVTTIVCLICYCCHRKIKMRSSTSSLYRQQRWLDNDPNMEIYSVEQYFDTSGLYSESENLPTMAAHNEPPPSYECVMALDEVISRKRKNLYTFKAYHHHPGLDIKNCVGGHSTPGPTTPQVSLDENHCDMRSPSSAASLCNCNCAINQNFTANLCTNCNTVIDNADGVNNNVTCTLITSGNPLQDNCSSSDFCPPETSSVEIDLLNDQLNNNNGGGESNDNCHTMDSIASPSTSTSTHYLTCSMPTSGERNKSSNDTENDDDDDEIDGNGNCRQAGSCANLSTNNRNGLIRLDMSQIIDQTGLPTYEAALHLKSSGYV